MPALLSRNAPIEVIIRHKRLFEVIVVYAMIDNELPSFTAANDFSSVDIHIVIFSSYLCYVRYTNMDPSLSKMAYLDYNGGK